jgi:2-polyprenyl-6-methoxyphenol hydroxylase-like FAD-dependent oxidoreductase
VASVDDGTAATDTKARITLTDGTVHEADLVIGADGIHSALRALSFGPEANFAERLGYRIAAFQVEDKLGLGHDFLSYAEPGRLSEFYTLSAERLATLYVWKSDLAGSIAEPCRRTVLKEAFAGGHPSCLQLIDDLADDEPLFFDDMTMIRMPAWSKGRVLLLGDSAHCLTLLSGQGAGMAMASACILADELARHDVPAALASHEARLRPAILRLQTRSLKMAPLFIPATNRAFSVRNFILRHTPRRLLNWYFVRGIRSEILAATEI